MKKIGRLAPIVFLLLMVIPVLGRFDTYYVHLKSSNFIMPYFIVSVGRILSPLYSTLLQRAYGFKEEYMLLAVAMDSFHGSPVETWYFQAFFIVYVLGFVSSLILWIVGFWNYKPFLRSLSGFISLGVCLLSVPYEILYLTSSAVTVGGIIYVSAYLLALLLISLFTFLPPKKGNEK